MLTKVDEPVEILIHFTKNGPKPLTFKWQERIYKVKRIDFVHPSFEGAELIMHFAVSTVSANYKLEFNTKHLTCKLKEIYSG